MIVATGVRLRVGARLLLDAATLRVGDENRIGLVGRNGAGKTTLARVLAGELAPEAGTVTRTGAVGYLPQDTRTSDPSLAARDRILSARGLDTTLRDLAAAQVRMGSSDPRTQQRAMAAYTRLDEQFTAHGGYGAEAEAARFAASLGMDERALRQPLGALSGGQRRRVELARVLFSGARTLLLDEPTNHLDADSVGWLRDYLRSYPGGLLVISHDASLLETVVNRVVHLDAGRAALDSYHVGWRAYLEQRETDERRRHRERRSAERKAAALLAQADSMRAKATKASAAASMTRRADLLLAGVEPARAAERVARLRFPDPAPCGRTPLTATGLTRSFGSLEVFTDVDLAVDRGSRTLVLGLNGAGKTTLLRVLAGLDDPDTGRVSAGHGLVLGYYAQEHENLDPGASVLANVRRAAPDLPEAQVRTVLGSFLFSGDEVDKPAGVLSGGEKTRLSLATLVVSSANVLLLDEPTNNLDPSSRAQVLGALRSYRGALVLVTHDEEAADALAPERVLLLPDGVEDWWKEDYRDLVALA